jgi:hypothetical protein
VGERFVLTGRPPVGDKREAMVLSSDDWLCLESTGERRVAATQSGKGAAGREGKDKETGCQKGTTSRAKRASELGGTHTHSTRERLAPIPQLDPL